MRDAQENTCRRWLAAALLAGFTGAVFAQSVIVDNDNANNPDGVFTVLGEAWATGTVTPGHWEQDYRYRSAGSGSGQVEWRPDLPAAGDYEVTIYFPEGSNRAPDAPFTVFHAAGSTTTFIDQRTNGGMWLSLGSYAFNAGSGGSVLLSDDATTGVVLADAVRFTPVSPDASAFRGVWIDAFGEGFKSPAEIDLLVQRALTGHYNAILPEVLAYQDTSTSNNGHGAFWHSSIVPWAAQVTGDFDPLAYLCERAHQHGIEVHAWLVTYRVCTSWPPAGNAIISAHPEWIMVSQADMGGGPATVDDKYVLDPGSPEVQEHILNIVRELVSGYEIDGIHFDYIRYTSVDAGYPADTGYDLSSLARYQSITGTTSTPGPTNTAWSDFRRRTIDELVRRCRAEIPSIRTNPRQPLRLTAALFASGGAPSDFTDSSAYELHQNWKHWLDMGWLDAACPMNYKDERNATHAAWYRSWIDAAVAWRAARHVYCGQACYLNSMANSIIQLAYVYGAGADGSVSYSYRATADEDDDGSSESDWTWYAYVAENFFTAPAPTPIMPWRDPALATEGTLWGQVTDYATGLPLDDAEVAVGGLPVVHTDGNGIYVVTLIPANAAGTSYTVTASTLVHSPRAELVDVWAGDVVRLDLALGLLPGDFDGDGDIDFDDLLAFSDCMDGPDITPSPDPPTEVADCLAVFDLDGDLDVDLRDHALFQALPAPPDLADVIIESRDATGAVLPPPTYVESGTWYDSTAKSSVEGLVGSGSRFMKYDLPNSGTDHATFVPAVAAAGLYEVFVTWGTGANCYDAQYTIVHAGGQAVLLVDQIPEGVAGANANTWVSLGQYEFEAGQNPATCSIDVSEETVSGIPHAGWNQRVYADAVKLVYVSR